MRRNLDPALWALAGLLATAVFIAAFPRAVPWFPDRWEVTRGDALALAEEHFHDLGPPVEDPYVISSLRGNPFLERRFQLASETVPDAGLAASDLAGRLVFWRINIYRPGARAAEWTYQARVTPRGELLALALNVPEEEGTGEVSSQAARETADALLRENGYDLARFGEPEERRLDRGNRTDLSLRYRNREAILGPDVPYGVEVTFAGDRLTGFQPWMDDPEQRAFGEAARAGQLLEIGRILVVYLLLLWVAAAFLRHYHAGEIGVRRSVEIFAVLMIASILVQLLSARLGSEGVQAGTLSQQQVTWFVGFWLLILYWGATSLLAALSWSTGEVRCRERMPQRLAAFDALFQGRWFNSTVARSALRGTAAGVVLTALLTLGAIWIRSWGGWVPLGVFLTHFSVPPLWIFAGLIAGALTTALAQELVGRLFFVPRAVGRFGRPLGALVAAAAAAALLEGPWSAEPVAAYLGLAFVAAAGLVFLFLRYDLLTTLLASAVVYLLPRSALLLQTGAPELQLEGGLALVLVALPMLLTVKELAGEQEFVYRWEDVPPHVRRIAERERQRVELETARGIQSSILPELPPQLHGVEIAHAYLPATEVGGDFYDVLALEDGRLALAVGDVAGHGVSSGLVMSMAKSALAVQVTFDPEVHAVFRTLNRTIFQTARRRLLTTLCYAVLDPRRRELLYASAGHLFPYVVESAGKVEALESVAYPLGVRGELEVTARTARLAAGSSLFFFSDGVVEARREGSEDLFGFERLEASLKRHAGAPPRGLLRGVLDDLARFTGPGPQEDDQTLLVLRLPA